MPRTVLVPQEIVERCYLSEALHWVALNRFPFSSFMADEGIDGREYADGIEGIQPSVDDVPVSDEECARAGLPLNPSWTELVEGDYHSSPSDIRHMMGLVEQIGEAQEKLENQLRESLDFERRQAAWDEEFDSFIDVHRSRLFLALREGRVKAVGKKLPRRTISDSLEHLEQTEWSDWGRQEWEPIPPTFWMSDRIEWDDCRAEGRQASYCLILVDTELLLEAFPAPSAAPIGTIMPVGDAFVLTESEAPLPKGLKSRGRPPLDWDTFHVEMAKRVMTGNLPSKQEACIAEMQAWCAKVWGKEVARSTLFQKIKAYYDALVRQSENAAK